MKGHVGTYASMGKGAIISSANRIKLNTTSSTETKIVDVGEKLTKNIWFQYFCKAQLGYVNEDIVY